LQRRSREDLALRYGETGEYLARLAQGVDHRPVRVERLAKSISAETTFERDISDAAELRRRLWPLCERVAERLKAKGLAGRTVTLKLKTARFRLMTRQGRLAAPT